MFQQLCGTKSQRQCPEKQLLRNKSACSKTMHPAMSAHLHLPALHLSMGSVKNQSTNLISKGTATSSSEPAFVQQIGDIRMKTLRYGFGLRIGPIVFLDKSQSESTLIPLTPTEFYKLRQNIMTCITNKLNKPCGFCGRKAP